MGLKVSTTCELTFGGDPARPAVGTLVGGVHDGIRQMFMVIEHARMLVGSKAIETLSTGYLNALEFAKSRVQGPDLARQFDKTSPRVTIINHPDVRRMLMQQKAYAEGLRALMLYTATQQDAVQLAAANGEPGRSRGRSQRPAAAAGQGGGLRARVRDAHALAADARRLRVPAGLPDRAVHQGLRRSTPCTRAPRPSSRSTSSSARSAATRAPPSRRCSPRSRPSPRPTTATAGSRPSGPPSPRASPTCRRR